MTTTRVRDGNYQLTINGQWMCLTCGATVDPIDGFALHDRWHAGPPITVDLPHLTKDQIDQVVRALNEQGRRLRTVQ